MSGPKSETDSDSNNDKRVKNDLIAHALLGRCACFRSSLLHETANWKNQPTNEHEHATPRRRNELGKKRQDQQQESGKSKPQPTPNVGEIKWGQVIWNTDLSSHGVTN